jgi:hypothetical protein
MVYVKTADTSLENEIATVKITRWRRWTFNWNISIITNIAR